MDRRCRICGNTHSNEEFRIREMMFGSGKDYMYFQCSHCRCLQIADVPVDMLEHYPDNYYSMKPENPLVFWLKCHWMSYSAFGRNPIGLLVSRVYGRHEVCDWMRIGTLRRDSHILDIGCGGGALLRKLAAIGFSKTEGLDKYTKEEGDVGGVTIWKREVSQLVSVYDFILLYYSLEHMDDHLQVLKDIHARLKPGKQVVIKIPVIDKYAWRTYGTNWMHLDAPRHFYIHSEKSMELLARAAGFHVAQIVYGSNASQFWGSEQYKEDVHLTDERSYAVDPSRSMFSKKRIREFSRLASKLNVEGDGDLVSFYLHKP